jgi:hypothetical protein
MRFIIALTVFSVGLGLYAVAALLFDRRRAVRAWQVARRRRAAGGGGVSTMQAVSTAPLYLIILGCLLGGTVLIFGSCAGLILW